MSGYIGPDPIPQAVMHDEVFTATSAQTTFATAGYTVGYIQVYQNGVLLTNTSDYTATNGSDVVLGTGATASDTIRVISFVPFEVVNLINTANQTFTGTTTVDILAVSGTVDGRDVATDGTKLDGIATSADYVAGDVAAKGDLMAGTAVDTLGVLTVGANDTVLTADSAETSGMKWAAAASGGPTIGTEQATTSGTAIDFTGVPAGTTRIDIAFDGVSLSDTDNFLVQLGDAGGFETTGYAANSDSIATTSGFNIANIWAGSTTTGPMRLTHMGGNSWVSNHQVYQWTTRYVDGAGAKTLSGELTQIRVTRDGTNTFDAGVVNIIYS